MPGLSAFWLLTYTWPAIMILQIDNNELEIDVLAEKIKEANGIIAFCSDKLTKADKEIEKLLSEKRESEE